MDGQAPLECRVRFLSFLGIGQNVQQAAFIMHTAQVNHSPPFTKVNQVNHSPGEPLYKDEEGLIGNGLGSVIDQFNIGGRFQFSSKANQGVIEAALLNRIKKNFGFLKVSGGRSIDRRGVQSSNSSWKIFQKTRAMLSAATQWIFSISWLPIHRSLLICTTVSLLYKFL